MTLLGLAAPPASLQNYAEAVLCSRGMMGVGSEPSSQLSPVLGLGQPHWPRSLLFPLCSHVLTPDNPGQGRGGKSPEPDKDRGIIRCLCFCKIKVLKVRQVYIGTELMAWCSARGQREQGAGPSISTRRWHRGRRCWHKSGPVQEISRMDDRQELMICYSHRARRCRICGWVSSGLIPAQECWVAPGGMSLPCTSRSMDGAAEQLCAHLSS